jgi:Cd2+/Zn2+-exporting ATPase/Cu+-exporting ATPase
MTVIDRISDIGGGEEVSAGTQEEHEHSGNIERRELARIAVVIIAAVAVWFRVWEPFNRVSVIGLMGMFVGGWPILAEAWENIRERRMTMELSMAIALLSALVIGEFFTALVIRCRSSRRPDRRTRPASNS